MYRFNWYNLAIYSLKEINDSALKQPEFALEFAAEVLTPETLEHCARRDPWAALRFAAERLTPETLDWCALKEPECALECAKGLLSPEIIKLAEDQLLIQKLAR
jgi:hypothetical protein